MQLRKLVLACGFVSFALSNYASALGLGEVKLNSTLNQPLNAEIKLLDTRDLSAEQIIIALASPADFERNGLERLYFYTQLQFQVDMKHAGGPIVRITSRNSVREPYLNFLIEARWSSGRLLRECTILMDLPTFDSTAPQAVQAPATAQPKVTATKPNPAPVAPVSEPASVESSAAASSPVASEPTPEVNAEQDRPKKKSRLSSGTYGPITEKDRLWDIAKAVRPDSSVTVRQTMLALQRLNPDAFIRGNINLLKKGQTLRVPDVSEASAVSPSDAVAQVNAQNTRWSTATTSTDTGLGAQLDASRATVNTHQKSEPVSGRVKLEAPSPGASAHGQGSGADKAGGKGAEADLAASLEELDKAKSENSELTSRVHELEEQIKTMQKLAEVSNEQMRSLQLNAAKQAESKPAENKPAETVTEAKPAAAVVQQESSSAVPAVVAEPTSTASVSSAATAEVAPAPVAASSAAAKPAPKKAKPVVEKTLLNQLSDNLLWVVLGAVGIVGFSAFLLRRHKDDEDEDSHTDAESFYIPEPSFEHLNEPQNKIETQLEPEDEVMVDEEDTSVVAETDDVVSEAGIYISLGKYPQAEDILLTALATNTANAGSGEIYLKLLEVYSQTQNITEFDKYYAALLPIGSSFALNRAAELRAGIIDAPAFAGVAAAEAVAVDEVVAANNDSSHAWDNPTINESFETPADETIDITPRSYDMGLNSTAVSNKPASLDLGKSEPFDVHPEAEDLSDISLALDSLDDRSEPLIDSEIEVATLEEDAIDVDEEISFDFNELDAAGTEFSAKDTSGLTTSGLKLQDEDHADDFNLEMDVDEMDLAALDREMESLDSDDSSAISAAVPPKEADALNDEDLQNFAALFDENEVAEDTQEAVTHTEFSSIDLELDDELNLPQDGGDELRHSTFDVNEEADDDFVMEADVQAGAAIDDAESEYPIADDSSLSDLDAELQNLQADKADAETPEDEAIDDEVFKQALSDFSAESLNAEAHAEDIAAESADMDLDFIVDADEAATKLDLARAYLDMGDSEGARDILAEVAQQGSGQQREEAISLLSKIDV